MATASTKKKKCNISEKDRAKTFSDYLHEHGGIFPKCVAGYSGNPPLGRSCSRNGNNNGNDCRCDPRGSASDRCDANGQCLCKMHTEGPTCSSCKLGHFHLSAAVREGCLPCFCMGVTQQCISSSYYRDLISTSFSPGNFQSFALVNRQRSTRIVTGFSVEVATDSTQLSYSRFGQLGQEALYWQLPENLQGDKREAFFARMRRAHKKDSTLTEEQLRKDAAVWNFMDSIDSMGEARSRSKRSLKSLSKLEEIKQLDDQIWALISNFSSSQPASSSSNPEPLAPAESRTFSRPVFVAPAGPPAPPSPRATTPSAPSPPSSFSSSFYVRAPLPPSPLSAPPGFASRLTETETYRQVLPAPREQRQPSTNLIPGLTLSPRGPRPVDSDKYALVYKGLSLLPDRLFYWQLPQHFKGDKIGSYGGRLRYTLSYNAGVRGSPVPDADVQIIGNDITLVSYHPEQLRPRERKTFEVIFREQYWKRPDGMQATREHLMMVLADLDEILVRASYSTDMLSTSISGVSMEVAVPTPTSLPQALEVEQCGCPPGYQGLSCQDCAPGYTRTGGGLYLGHCELCDCNGHSDSCHPETGVCTSCLHNTFGQMCEQCASGFYGDPTAGTPEDCQRCACPLPDQESQFSPTCESQGSGYRCTACQPGYTGQYCERCATGYVGKPLEGTKCRPFNPSPLVVQVYPERTVVSQDSDVTLRCQVTGTPPHYFYWTRTDGRALPSSAHTQRDGKELHFSRIQPNDAGVYVCTCRDLRNANTSRAEIIVTAVPSKAIEVTVEEPKEQSVSPGSTVSFICTARSKSPAYTLVWTRQNNGKLPDRAMDFNGILTIHNVQPEDAGLYVCTGSNMFDMDEGTALLYVAAASQTRMFYQAYEMLEGHRAPVAGVQPVATIAPPVLTVQQGQRAEFRCTVTGNPPPAIEWFGGQGNRISPNAIIQGGVLQIPTVERSDEAEYICRALNIHGEHSARAVLYVHSASLPHVQVSPQRIEVSEGEPVRLYCRAGGTPSPALTWKKLDGQLPQQAIPSLGFHQFKSNSLDVLQRRIEELQARTERTDIGTLVIPSAKASDAGVYLCVGTNSIGSSEGRIEVSVHSVAIAPFSVTIQPSPASVQEGKSLDLNCIVRGAPAPSITWHRSGGPLASNHQVIGPQLRVLQATSSDSGEYICRASSIAGVQQATVSVSITDTSSRQQSPIISIEPHSASVIQGQSASFRCRVYSGAQPIRIEWKMANNQPLLDNVKMTQDGSVITISNTRHGNQGAYRCVASNPFGITHSIVSLLVQAPPTVSVTPQGPVRVKVGEPINLECLGMGEPRPAVSWRRVDSAQRVVLQSPVPMDSNAVMQVLAARPEDAGTYTCVARNPVGSAQKQVEVVVEGGSVVPTIPKVSVAEPMVIAVERGTATLRCTATGYPIPTITWSKLRAPLPWQHKVVNNSLVIPNLGRQDSGQYICNATNAAGTSEITIMLDVESPPYATFLPDDLTVRVGEVIRLQCLAHGTHPLQYQWSKVNGTLPTRVEVQEGTLQINLATAADSGTYKCVVKNNVGTSDTLAKVNVIPPPTVLVAPPTVSVTPQGPVWVKVGEPINLECLGMGEPRPAVSWRRVDSTQRVVLQSPVPMDSNAVMQVLAARPEDAGTYTCVARNPVGSAQKQVEVVVEGGSVVPTIPKVSVVEPMVMAVERGTATLRCTATGYPIPTITWSKLRAPLPWQHKVVNNSLVIPNLGRQDSGQYICNATNAAGTSEITIMLDVESPPYATFLPDDLTVRVGEVIRLQCLAHGTHPLQYQWSKVNGTLPTRAEVQEGTLQINLATAADSGTYKCVVKNNVGTSDTLAKVNVRSPLSVRVSPQVEVKGRGSTVEFTCSATGGAKTRIEWLKEGGSLPPNHHVDNGVLRIENLEQDNEGVYVCRATNMFGQAQDSGKLTIQALPKVMINVRTSVQTVMVGNQVEFECQAIGDPQPTVTWSKVNGRLPSHIIVQGGMLKIEQVKEADAGHYRCTATNTVGSVQSEVVLNVQSIPQIAAQPKVKEVTVGSTAVFPCMASGYPAPDIKWTKMEGNLPQSARVEDHVLTIPSVTPEHSGTYICTASNKQGKVQAFSVLTVRERVVPYFTQTPLSYLTLPTIKNAYKTFNIKITFRPDTADGVILYSGMIIYNGQKKTTGADFISFGLVGSRPEFRFDVGSGMATIRYPTSIKLGEFHTVVLYRNQTQGAIVVDDDAPVNGSSQGKFQGLDLNEELHVGGYPDFAVISKTTGLKSGFVGCIRQLIIQGDEVIFKALDQSSTGISDCPTCTDQPCQNSGVCEDSETSSYICHCPIGFTGSNCEHYSALHCHPEACGPDATCINRHNGLGYDCRCHLGKSGDKCMEGILVTSPSFNGEDSYVSYPPMTIVHNDLRMDLELKPLDSDGLLFFSGGKKMKVEDFVSLAMVDGHVEFRFELGTGMAVLRSPEPVALGRWHRIMAERSSKDGTLRVDHQKEIKRSSPGKAQGLNIYTPMYLGGVPNMAILPEPANISRLFHGCIGELSINGKKVDISYIFTDSRNIAQCYDEIPCDRMPCLHGGSCLLTGEFEYQCICQDGYEGDRCEIFKDMCLSGNPCKNGGSCSKNQCVCPLGFTGQLCEKDSPIQYSAYFHDDGYMALPKPMFPRSSPETPETIVLEARTTSADGLILWQGVDPNGASPQLHDFNEELGEDGKSKDFVSLGLQDGHLVFSYQLGSGEASIVSEDPINDGDWHKITAVRAGRVGSIQIDGDDIVTGESGGTKVMVNTHGNIYLGGAPDIFTLTGGKFSSGVTGCIRNVVLMNARPGDQSQQPIDLQVHAEEGVHVEKCPS